MRLLDFNQIWILSTDFHRRSRIKFYWNPSIESRADTCMQTDGPANISKLVDAFARRRTRLSMNCKCSKIGAWNELLLRSRFEPITLRYKHFSACLFLLITNPLLRSVFEAVLIVCVCVCVRVRAPTALAHLRLYPQWSVGDFLHAWLLNTRS